MTTSTYYRSPVGMLELIADETALLSCGFIADQQTQPVEMTPFLTECVAQLDAYFRGELHQFSLSLKPAGSTFAQRVWQQLQQIPFGKTVSYSEIAAHIEQPQAARAVGHANSRNPIAILIPCHRVITRQGTLGGYAYGVWRKSWLLAHEQRKLF